ARFLLQGLPADAAVRRDADAIRVASERAAGLTRQLLLLSRRDTIVPRRIAPDAVIAGYLELLERIVGTHVHVVATLDAAGVATLLDPVHLEQVLLNLALNARDAMADGGALHIETARLAPREVEFAAPLGAVRLRVRDTGSGMAPETVARAFEPFFTTKEAGRGTGIGLATVLGIAEQAGGRVALESAPGVGTTVTLWFPIADGAPEPAAPPEPAAVAGPPEAWRRILLVEDEPDVRGLVERALHEAGYRVVVAHDGIDALERWLDAAADDARFHALVSDIRMPRLNGRDLARALRAEQPDLPVVLMSGFDDPEVLGEVVTMPGAFRFLAKPFGPETLVRTVAGVLRDLATARALAAAVDPP
ncbi:MAG: response regulator, partial [Gemmatimonadaceae bacterium]|nr:response regulator [Gemmatimonadaceae bacterium]